MSNSYHRQVPPSYSTSDELCTRVGMSGARLWFLHQHCPLQVTGGGARPATRCTSPTGQRSLRHPKSARSLYLAHARRVVQRGASAGKQNWNVQHCAIAEGSARITEVIQELNFTCRVLMTMLLYSVHLIVTMISLRLRKNGGHYYGRPFCQLAPNY